MQYEWIIYIILIVVLQFAIFSIIKLSSSSLFENVILYALRKNINSNVNRSFPKYIMLYLHFIIFIFCLNVDKIIFILFYLFFYYVLTSHINEINCAYFYLFSGRKERKWAIFGFYHYRKYLLDLIRVLSNYHRDAEYNII